MQYWIHHLNDTSGSPLILAEKLKSLSPHEEVTLITNQGTGFLSDWAGKKVEISYTKHSSKILRFLSLSLWYLKTFFYLVRRAKTGDSLFLSTLVSSPLIALRFIIPLHSIKISINEVFFRVPIWRAIGISLARAQSVEKEFLSYYVKEAWGFKGKSEVVYPKLRNELFTLARNKRRGALINPSKLSFFLVGSYIEAKGYKLFIELARYYDGLRSEHKFSLYLSGSKLEFFREYPNSSLPKNLNVYFNNSSPQIFDGHDVFLGLTNPKLWIETFGQTFAEAMLMENIVIAPNVGAQLEYAEDGRNAFLFTEYSIEGIVAQISRIQELKNPNQFAATASQTIFDFYNEDRDLQIAK